MSRRANCAPTYGEVIDHAEAGGYFGRGTQGAKQIPSRERDPITGFTRVLKAEGVYTTPSGTAMVEVVWARPWTAKRARYVRPRPIAVETLRRYTMLADAPAHWPGVLNRNGYAADPPPAPDPLPSYSSPSPEAAKVLDELFTFPDQPADDLLTVERIAELSPPDPLIAKLTELIVKLTEAVETLQENSEVTRELVASVQTAMYDAGELKPANVG